jgi:hypothetical protein
MTEVIVFAVSFVLGLVAGAVVFLRWLGDRMAALLRTDCEVCHARKGGVIVGRWNARLRGPMAFHVLCEACSNHYDNVAENAGPPAWSKGG